MKLLIKQRVFSWTDTYDVYDDNENVKYGVKAEFFTLGHKIYVYDCSNHEVGAINQKLLSLFPVFEVIIDGRKIGMIQKKFSVFRPRYEIDYNGWQIEGDFLGWDYQVERNGYGICHISKEPFHWGDTYVLDFQKQEDEVLLLLLVLAIDAANCTDNN